MSEKKTDQLINFFEAKWRLEGQAAGASRKKKTSNSLYTRAGEKRGKNVLSNVAATEVATTILAPLESYWSGFFGEKDE